MAGQPKRPAGRGLAASGLTPSRKHGEETTSTPRPVIIVNPYTEPLPLEFFKRELDGETVALLIASIPYNTGKGPIIVPAGFDSDGCSMPRFFWRLFGHPFDMDYLREAILHDYLYRMQIFDRETSDLLFKEQMEDKVSFAKAALRQTILAELPKGSDKEINKEYKRRLRRMKLLSQWRINNIYWGLRMGGGSAWKKNGKLLAEAKSTQPETSGRT